LAGADADAAVALSFRAGCRRQDAGCRTRDSGCRVLGSENGITRHLRSTPNCAGLPD